MLPWWNHYVVRTLYQERIQEAEARHPECSYEERLAPRPSIAQRLGQWWRSRKREKRTRDVTGIRTTERVIDLS